MAARAREHWVPALASVLLGLVAAIGYVLLTPPSYVSSASVVVQPVVADQFGNINLSNVINMSTEEQVARSSAVASTAGERLGRDADVVHDSYTVDSPQDTQVLNIHFAASTAEGAAAGAQTVAESYLSYREGSAQEDADRRLKSIAAQIATLEARIAEGKQVAAYQESLQSLLSDQRVLTSIKATSGGRVITSAVAPVGQSSPRPLIDVTIGLAAGVIVGLVLAVTWPGRVRTARGGRRSRH